jgi:biopolymer transport protein ExbB/biopolymer transport protein TolQ
MEGTSFGPVEIWRSMGTVGHTVLIFLLLMSIYSIGVMIERYVLLNKARKQSLRFVEAAKSLLPKGDVEHLLQETQKFPKSHLARVYAAALVDWYDYGKNPEPPSGFEETMARAVDREAVLVVQEFKRGLSGLASIGATAPFVGLFGTVVGIMNAFFAMARSGQGGITTVAGGIAEALVNTAVGLFVALPAVWGFNYFLNRVERLNAEMTNTGTELVDYFVKRARSERWRSAIHDR